jgi:hypothetical protein
MVVSNKLLALTGYQAKLTDDDDNVGNDVGDGVCRATALGNFTFCVAISGLTGWLS